MILDMAEHSQSIFVSITMDVHHARRLIMIGELTRQQSLSYPELEEAMVNGSYKPGLICLMVSLEGLCHCSDRLIE